VASHADDCVTDRLLGVRQRVLCVGRARLAAACILLVAGCGLVCPRGAPMQVCGSGQTVATGSCRDMRLHVHDGVRCIGLVDFEGTPLRRGYLSYPKLLTSSSMVEGLRPVPAVAREGAFTLRLPPGSYGLVQWQDQGGVLLGARWIQESGTAGRVAIRAQTEMERHVELRVSVEGGGPWTGRVHVLVPESRLGAGLVARSCLTKLSSCDLAA